MVLSQEAVRPLSAAGVTVVIPVWNQAEMLRRLLRTIAAQTLQPERVLVVNNASTENIEDVAREWGAEITRLPFNAGFAVGVNQGIASARTDWVALLNSDVELDRRWLERLLDRARETGAWYACGKLLTAADRARIDGTWDLIACSGCAYRAGNGRTDDGRFSNERRIALCPATAAIYRRELFERVGAFSEVYESYLEDVDFSVRCAAANYLGIYVPEAVAAHVGQGSSGRWNARVVELTARNQVVLVNRLYPAELRRRFRWKIIAGQWLWGCVAARHGRLGAWLRGRRAARTLPFATEPLAETSLRDLLFASERELRALQSEKPDLYWRLYFLITGSESE